MGLIGSRRSLAFFIFCCAPIRFFVGRGSPDPARAPDRRSPSFGVCSATAYLESARTCDEYRRPSVGRSGAVGRPAPNRVRPESLTYEIRMTPERTQPPTFHQPSPAHGSQPRAQARRHAHEGQAKEMSDRDGSVDWTDQSTTIELATLGDLARSKGFSSAPSLNNEPADSDEDRARKHLPLHTIYGVLQISLVHLRRFRSET